MPIREIAEQAVDNVFRRGILLDRHRNALVAEIEDAIRNERERCGKIAEKYVADMRSVTHRTEYGEGCLNAAVYIAEQIRKED